ncbi:hypothetical protein CGLO_18145 [Colletotrichum gloeosporioides Cg-14]|uniref:Uncharacterized protein n=1 Tax=Colletotrichum gloeosporioides (strain Cg-14) TaxID=1237896 RepID=T0KV70_COLGC|nr:hypothetical protein CGLO_18145 [Colletotrichum gloeosporioides Cg-14]
MAAQHSTPLNEDSDEESLTLLQKWHEVIEMQHKASITAAAAAARSAASPMNISDPDGNSTDDDPDTHEDDLIPLRYRSGRGRKNGEVESGRARFWANCKAIRREQWLEKSRFESLLRESSFIGGPHWNEMEIQKPGAATPALLHDGLRGGLDWKRGMDTFTVTNSDFEVQ